MKQKVSYELSWLVAGSLAIFLLIVITLNTCVIQDAQNLTITKTPFPEFHPAAYPELTAKILPDISAESAIIMDATSHVFLYQKNTQLRLSPASTTKMMTALVSLDYFHPTDVLTVKSVIDTEGSGLGFTHGEQFTYKSLLKAALIYSANDAAYTIADNYPGGEKAFVAAMNARARAMHLWNTHFGDPDGLDDTQDYTTAPDLMQIVATAMHNPLFRSIVKIKSTDITSIDGRRTYQFDNRNILLGFDGIDGIKTGYTDEAGEVLATSVEKNGHTFYFIVMKSQDRFADTLKLLPILNTVTFVSMRQ